MKNLIRGFLVFSICILIGFTNDVFAIELAKPSKSAVLVNGEKVSLEAYNINNNNYFKLRDLAVILNNSASKFEVEWDVEKKAINLITGRSYTPVGGELLISESIKSKETNLSSSKIYLNGEEVNLMAYNISGNNYFKLRDLGQAIGFEVDWNQEESTIMINSGKEAIKHSNVKDVKEFIGGWAKIKTINGMKYIDQLEIREDKTFEYLYYDEDNLNGIQVLEGEVLIIEESAEKGFKYRLIAKTGTASDFNGEYHFADLSLIKGKAINDIKIINEEKNLNMFVESIYGVLEADFVSEAYKYYFAPANRE